MLHLILQFVHSKTKKIYARLDDDLVTHWEDRDKNIDDIVAYVPILDVVKIENYIVEYNDFEEEFFPLYEGFFEEWELYALDLDELQVRKLKKFFDEIGDEDKQVLEEIINRSTKKGFIQYDASFNERLQEMAK